MLRWARDQTFSFDHIQLKVDTSQTIKREKKALKKRRKTRRKEKREKPSLAAMHRGGGKR